MISVPKLRIFVLSNKTLYFAFTAPPPQLQNVPHSIFRKLAALHRKDGTQISQKEQ